MYLFGGTVRAASGAAYASAAVAVYKDATTEDLAELYDDQGSATSNPTTTDSGGRVYVQIDPADTETPYFLVTGESERRMLPMILRPADLEAAVAALVAFYPTSEDIVSVGRNYVGSGTPGASTPASPAPAKGDAWDQTPAV